MFTSFGDSCQDQCIMTTCGRSECGAIVIFTLAGLIVRLHSVLSHIRCSLTTYLGSCSCPLF